MNRDHREKPNHKIKEDNFEPETRNKKKINIQKISRNMLQCISSYLSLSECFMFMKLDKRSRETILERQYLFLIFLYSIKMNNIDMDFFEDYCDIFLSLIKEKSPKFLGLLEFCNFKILPMTKLDQNEKDIILFEILYLLSKLGMKYMDNRDNISLKYIQLLSSRDIVQLI